MAKRRRRPPEALVFREGEVCVPATRRGAWPHTRKVIVDCEVAPRRRRPEAATEPAFVPHCTNETCQCGVSYDKFRSGWTFAEAAEMVGARGKGGGVQTFRPSRAKILRMMAKLKRDEWEAHQRACTAQPSAFVDDVGVDWTAGPEDDFLSGVAKKKRKPKKKPTKQSSFSFENDSFALTVQDAPESWGKFTATEQKQMKLLSGWKRRAPSRVTERREMPAACFLAPGRKYPICPKGTRGKVRVDCAGLQAAFSRARQQGDERVAKRARALQKKHCEVRR